MAEWPIIVAQDRISGAYLGGKRFEPMTAPNIGEKVEWGPQTEVIPADLGRELYEAVREVEPPSHANRPKARARLEAALARYEREVGE